MNLHAPDGHVIGLAPDLIVNTYLQHASSKCSNGFDRFHVHLHMLKKWAFSPYFGEKVDPAEAKFLSIFGMKAKPKPEETHALDVSYAVVALDPLVKAYMADAASAWAKYQSKPTYTVDGLQFASWKGFEDYQAWMQASGEVGL